MASLFTHALVGAAFGQAANSEQRKRPAFWAATVVCSMLPDVDVIGFPLGIRYGDLWGHRGMTHSLLFAAVTGGLVALFLAKTSAERWWLGLLLFVITASHGALDAMTNGGLGVAFFSPFDATRYFLPWRPIAVSPIRAGQFFSDRGLYVLWTEIIWVWGPALLVGAALRAKAKAWSRFAALRAG
jgi:inner membrane protein